jgi:undecaprenyl pyrophosphate phosphatase UppP
MHVPLLVGILVSAMVGYGAIAWLIRYLQSNSLRFSLSTASSLGVVVIALAFAMHLQ